MVTLAVLAVTDALRKRCELASGWPIIFTAVPENFSEFSAGVAAGAVCGGRLSGVTGVDTASLAAGAMGVDSTTFVAVATMRRAFTTCTATVVKLTAPSVRPGR